MGTPIRKLDTESFEVFKTVTGVVMFILINNNAKATKRDLNYIQV